MVAVRDLADETVECFHHRLKRVISDHLGADQNSLELLLIRPLYMVSHVGVKISAGERDTWMKNLPYFSHSCHFVLTKNLNECCQLCYSKIKCGKSGKETVTSQVTV